MLKPENVLKLLRTQGYGGTPLEEARFIRIAFFPSPDEGREYNGYAVQLSGNDVYGGGILLKTLEVNPDVQHHYLKNSIFGAAEWEWNGGEDLVGEQLEEAQELYNNFLLMKINEEVLRLSEELTETEEAYRLGHISSDAFDNIRYSIYRKAERLWLNEQGPGRFPDWFEELDVPENLRDVFNDTFGDCYIPTLQ